MIQSYKMIANNYVPRILGFPLLLKEELMPPNGILASENIYNYLCKQLKIESRR